VQLSKSLAVSFGVVVAASGLTAMPANADILNGRIAYERYVDYTDPEGFPRSASDIFTSELDGTLEVNVTNTEAVGDIQAAWSPDGTRIAFSSNRDGNYDIFTMAADGSDVRQVTFTFGIEYEGGYIDYDSSFEPTWSPDATQIAFTGYRAGVGQPEVFIVLVDATEATYAETRVTDGADFMSSSHPDWSPDGTKLVYNQYWDSYTTDIWTIGVDGTGATNLTSAAGTYVTDLDPSWSPDGTRITWVSNRAAQDPLGVQTDVYVMQGDGSGVVQATVDTEVEFDPEFSPDGLQILYQRNYYNPEIWVIDAPATPVAAAGARTAGTPVQVGSGGGPSWQPLGGEPPATAALTVTKKGKGKVTSAPAGINCGADCTETYTSGTSVTLTATPNAGSTFTGWTGACTGTGICTVTMDAAKSATATFTTAASSYALTVTRAGKGKVTSAPAGINCGTDCTETYTSGTSVTLTATPNAGSTFTGWSGACTGTGTCVVTMSAAKSVTATFTTAASSYTLTATKAGNGRGKVTSAPAGINCGTDCTETYTSGTTVTLTATPATGSTFTGWTGACTGTGACTVTMSAAKTATATFTKP